MTYGIVAQSEPRWPPRSPYEALLSSPTGKRKIRQYHDRTSPSPSPLKGSSSIRSIGKLRRPSIHQETVECGEEEDEDEETLQLQLAAIEAKLKLKRLQEKKNYAPACNTDSRFHRRSQAAGKENSRPSSQNPDRSNTPRLARPKTAADVQIPVSPQRKHVGVEQATSPGRVLLGIDKGLKGRNVSLRRPMGESSKNDDPFQTCLPPVSVSRTSGNCRSTSTTGEDQRSRPKSFSEKIAETRQQDKALKERHDKIRRQRSTGFGVNQQDIDAFNSAVETRSTVQRQSRPGHGEFSRDEILKAAHEANGGLTNSSNAITDIRRSRATPSSDIWVNPNASPEALHPPKLSNVAKKRSPSPSPDTKTTGSSVEKNDSEASAPLFEPFSSLHLSKRLLPHDFLTRTLSGKHVFLLPDLLGAVKSPNYVLPDFAEPDHVVFAIIASKSSPLSHKGAHKSTNAEATSLDEAADSEQNTNGKYMVLTLTNLKWTVDLFLFATGYTRFRKLTPGTIIALLNPDVMPPPPGRADTGRFSLKLSSSDDTVLEIGTSRDLGWCKSVRKDGKRCESWIDKRHTEFCEFHVDVGIERTRRGRMEVQGMSAPFAPGGRRGGRTGYFGDKKRGSKTMRDDGFAKEGPQYDRGSGSRYFVAPSIPGQSAAQLLDAEGATDRYGSKEERVRKRLAEREKETEVARKLGKGGNGAGSKYLRVKQGLDSTLSTTDAARAPEPVDVASLGLFGNKAGNVHLSPIKKKRKSSVLSMDGPRKKTRFVTSAGIKEAGRESLGGDVAVGDHEGEDEDEDGLEVV